ncbi:MAG: 50S ribosomal protein L15 [Parcubacteria group bacterium GW2011_GWC1_43_11b]|uniref:Large ribosomal subunit protein uL15 n=2 Tax=Candidatus Vogeliibacteriota TaxID=1817922 RepID=A0A1G2QBL9_9BACT|nr:MAG: 50S ribosomal protein L15 [Parcubacteria group bacterium GW2011_GWB1_42_9]KKS89088.1 MAG: 50S ribosomal protein L15 [Parcubacteria group bacterium GW2011_GWC1_43_11b]KKT09738.1 MAG: 50S ribosomal protein L15 [Parcubacteria group bacterium GW2011_GWA1_43_21]OHA57955.1 MAG: 50S ribosomal protein L15 [Candidatus Vogelbacteria bacterium RIFOXYB1_FULL_42_16]OHA59063.1 MAG: 50S ribosomal protein L15 [Candidatus Vogelbacteria bacterium RIFOXYD1_FULL_42_15]
MQIHDLKPKTKQKKSRQIGRGGKRGTTSGRGTKGQSARAGNKKRPELRDIIKKLPKLRGYRFSPNSGNALPVNLATIDKKFVSGEEVSAKTLLEKGLIDSKKGKMPAVKILATGTLTKALNFQGLKVSASALAKIEQAGGKVS